MRRGVGVGREDTEGQSKREKEDVDGSRWNGFKRVIGYYGNMRKCVLFTLLF
jgi:hypothetical protein